MTSATLSGQAGEEHIDFADMRRRIRAIFIGSIGNLVEWYDFYAYAAFALYFAGAFFPTPTQSYSNLMLHCCLRRVSWFDLWGDGCSVT
jgi:hypothetical protein